MAESTWCRAWKDTERFRHRGLFFWGCQMPGVVLFAVVGALLLPEQPSRLESALYPGLGIVAGFAAVFLVVFIWNLFRAPYRQRNEVRGLTQVYAGQLEEIKQKSTNKIYKLKEELDDEFLQEDQRKHLDKIKNLISNWMEGLSVPRISEVMPGTVSGMDTVKNNPRFVYLKEHLPFKELWQQFNDWDSKIQEYLSKCKELRAEIKESWKIDGTQATSLFAGPILEMIDGEKSDLNFLIAYDPELGEEEVSHQVLTVNMTDVVRGTLSGHTKTFAALTHYKCCCLTLPIEYQKLANGSLNQPLITELRELSSSLITMKSDIQESLRQILEKADYKKHSCKACPIREKTT